MAAPYSQPNTYQETIINISRPSRHHVKFNDYVEARQQVFLRAKEPKLISRLLQFLSISAHLNLTAKTSVATTAARPAPAKSIFL